MDFVKRIGTRNLFFLIAILMIALALPLVVAVSRQQQEVRQRASDLTVCSDVITYGVNKTTGECIEFPNSCIPDEYQKVPSCRFFSVTPISATIPAPTNAESCVEPPLCLKSNPPCEVVPPPGKEWCTVNPLPTQSSTPTPTCMPLPTPRCIGADGPCFMPPYPSGNWCKTSSTPAPTKPPIVCIQVITSAINPSTGECRAFSTPCDVPSGWQVTNECPSSPTNPAPTSAKSVIPADVNRNGCVDILDFNLWLTSYQGKTIAEVIIFPDINSNGTVDLLDFNEWFNAMHTLPADKLCS